MHKKFLKLPYLLQFLILNLYAIIIRKKRYSKDFYQALNYFRSVDRTEQNILNMDKIREVINGSNFYSIENEQQFFAAPVLSKEVVKANWDKIVNPKFVYKYFNTSGTTGSGLKFPVCRNFLNAQWAVFWKFRYLYDLNTKSWCAYIIGKSILNAEKKKPPFWIKSFPTQQYLFSSSHLNSHTVELYLKKIRKSGIRWMHGFPSTLNDLAVLIEQNNLSYLAADLNLDIITTSSETLFDFQKRNIEEMFKCKVKQLYGLTEGVANIFECEKGSLHVDESFSFVEFLKIKGSKDYYRVVGSTYFNKAFPLIRYDTGDTVRITNPEFVCGCGRKSRVVDEILGREQDFLILEDGTRVGGSGFFFKKAVNVKRAQIRQSKKGEATFYIVKGPAYSRVEEEIVVNEIKNKLGDNFKYNIVYTDTLIRLKNGKMKFVINDIEDSYPQEYESVNIKDIEMETEELSMNLYRM